LGFEVTIGPMLGGVMLYQKNLEKKLDALWQKQEPKRKPY
jgi:hypothetical protein